MSSALEDIKAIDLEEWLTLNTAASPTKLPQGQTPNCSNVWTDEKPGSVITANGYLKVGTSPSGNPTTFCINYFKTSSGDQVFVLSDNSTVWKTIDFQNFTSLITGLSSSFQLRGLVIRDKLWLTNGSDSVRTYDGTTVTVLDGSGVTPNVPKGRYIAYTDERVWMYHLPSDRSAVRFSALTDNTAAIIAPDTANAWPSTNSLQISEGDADFGTGMLLYRGFLNFFKQYTIWRLVGFDEYSYSRVKTRASTGTRFAESIQVLDSMVHFIGIDGIYQFDGEETDRISDIIDPASAEQTAFGFNELQQPNTNNTFWETTATADWNTGTVPTNVTIDDSLTFKAADDVTSDFNSGTKTNVTAGDIADELILTITSSGASNRNVAAGVSGSLVPISNTGVVGVAAFMTDSDNGNACGFSGSPSLSTGTFNISVVSTNSLTTIILRGVFSGNAIMEIKNAGVSMTPSAVSSGLTISANAINFPPVATPTDYTITYPAFTTAGLQLVMTAIASNTSFTLTEIEVYTGAYNTTGKFVSKSVDLGEVTPPSIGNFNADVNIPANCGLTFATQTSADNSSWDAEVAVTNGSAVTSTARRYIRWVANYTSNGSDTPVITAAYLVSQYFSPIHNTGGSIYAWGPFEADYAQSGQTVKFYYRTATTAVGVASASWNLIVPGGVVNDAVANQYIQFKIAILGGTATQLPSVTSVTINWTVGTGTQPNTLQNVASIVWRNRYWLAAAGPGATRNDTILIRGKKTFKNPWMLKDWSILSFTKFHDNLYGCSSVDGSIYRLDEGYSKDGSAMDSFFETGDFTFGGFYGKLQEILIEVERLGSYSLSVGVSLDRGNTWTEKTVDLTLTSGASVYTKRLNFSAMGDKMRFRVRTNGADQPFQVHRLIAYYQIIKARGSLN